MVAKSARRDGVVVTAIVGKQGSASALYLVRVRDMPSKTKSLVEIFFVFKVVFTSIWTMFHLYMSERRQKHLDIKTESSFYCDSITKELSGTVTISLQIRIANYSLVVSIYVYWKTQVDFWCSIKYAFYLMNEFRKDETQLI